MPKNMKQFRPSEPRHVADELHRAVVTQLPIHERQQSDAKEKQRGSRSAQRFAELYGFAAARRDTSARHPNTGTVWDYPAATFPPREKPTGRNKGVPFFGMPSWYRRAMQHQNVTPAQFTYWREHFVNLTQGECAALFRVNRKTIENWEKGESSIPFAVWYVMHCHIQKPEVWLSRCGFTDLYIDFQDGIGYLCSVEYPDIRFTHGDLVCYAMAMRHLNIVKAEAAHAKARIAELTAENTELRRMFKGHQVAAELERMQAQISGLLNKMHTADVYAFPVESAGEMDQKVPRAAGAR